jgi:DNA polymerase elongation subunit (family B)
MLLSPIEQYLISTGKRLFKGYEDYNDIEKLVFDLETTGLDPEVSRIFMVGCKTNKGLEELFDCETEGDDANKTEVSAILKFFKVIETVKPSIIGGYNSANFDWPFIFTRCKKLGIDITEIAKTLKPGEVIFNKEIIKIFCKSYFLMHIFGSASTKI